MTRWAMGSSACWSDGITSTVAGGAFTDVDDAELVRRAKTGDRSALGDLYDRHAGAMLVLARRWLTERAAAEDLVHNVFLEAWRRIRTYDEGRGTVRTWLFTILRSRSLDARRARGRSLEDLNPTADDPAGAQRLGAARPSERLGEFGELHDRLAALSEPHQQVIRLVYFEGWTVPEVAAHLGEPVGTLKARLSRGLDRLRSSMRGEDP